MSAPSKRASELRQSPLRAAAIEPVPRVPASAGQRAKVLSMRCAVCGRSPVDPAHLVPQRLGGCAHPDCVIALCRTHHRLFDSGRLALAPYLGRRFKAERTHALKHAGPTELKRALNGHGWPPPWAQQSIQKRK